MNWLNLQVSVVRSPEYAGCDPVQRATWFNVLAYSAEQENHGRIEGCRGWKDRQWQQTCGVTLAEVDGAAPLLAWDGDALVVWAYPAEKQAEVQAKREGGKRGGQKSAEARAEAAAKHPAKLHSSSASSNGSSSASTEGKGKGMERKENGKEPTGVGGITDGKGSSKNLPTTPQSKRVAAIFHRRETTVWGDDEVKAYRALGTIPEEDLAAIERYYAENWPPRTGQNMLRHDLSTFLNNFSGELDRARNHVSKNSNPKSRI